MYAAYCIAGLTFNGHAQVIAAEQNTLLGFCFGIGKRRLDVTHYCSLLLRQ